LKKLGHYKTRQIVLLLWITILAPSTLFSQISGYMGKRFSLGYGGNIGYAMFNPNSNGSSLFGNSEVDFPEKLFSTNYKHQVQMEWVVSNKSVIGAQGSFGKTQFKAIKASDLYYSYATDYHYFLYYPIGKDVFANLNFFTVGMYLKKFTENLAPVGKYWEYKLSVLRYVADISEMKMPSGYPKLTIPTNEYHTSLVFAISRGTSRVYANRFIVDSNFEVGLPFMMPYFGFDTSDYNYDPKTYNDLFAKRMRNRLWGNFLVNINVNISLLAF